MSNPSLMLSINLKFYNIKIFDSRTFLFLLLLIKFIKGALNNYNFLTKTIYKQKKYFFLI